MGDVLASKDDDGRGRLRKVWGSCQTNVDPKAFAIVQTMGFSLPDGIVRLGGPASQFQIIIDSNPL
jgi:hypothetical protein